MHERGHARRCRTTTPSNPATLSVLDGEALWKQQGWRAPAKPAPTAMAMRRPRCAASRRAIRPSARRKAARSIIEQRINLCRTEQQKAAPLAHESRELLALTAYRRQAVARPADRGRERREDASRSSRRARRLIQRRQGQLNLSCQNCHDDNWGQKLAGVPLVQGHPNGYPLYRLEWQSLGSLQRRLRNCLIGMRAEPYAYGADELCRSGALPDVARARHDGRDAGGAAVERGLEWLDGNRPAGGRR